MRAKSLVLLLIAIGCGVVASVAVSQVVLEQKEQPTVQTVGIVLAKKNISAASKLTAESLKIEQWPSDRVPPGAITDQALAEGKFAKQPIYANEPIIEVKLANKGKEVIIPDGFRVFDIVVRDETGGSGYLAPGDRVDVFGFFEKGQRISASRTIKVLENIEVLMVDGVASVDLEAQDSAKKSVRTIQLLVKDKQYSVLDTASHLGKLRLALRPPEKDEITANNVDDGEEFMSWLNEIEKGDKESQGSEILAAASKAISEVAAERAAPAPTADKHVMTILTPESVSKYRWKDDSELPEKVEGTPDNKSATLSAIKSLAPAATAQPSPYTTPATSNAGQPSLVWDPVSGTWQSGGNGGDKAAPSTAK
ncbi:MAG: Flp pilus assembly protein CpaB [Pirellula sp.]|jgi:pilus assembly protein CpaB|nr:Flp pilus assembly protein CpaB [Pirellula sp.]